MSRDLEKWVQFEILEKWGAHPMIRIARINTGAAKPPGSNRLVRYGVPGTADIVGIIRPSGRMLMIECKRPSGGVQSDEQIAMQKVVSEYGGLYIIARSLTDVDRELSKIGLYR